MEDLDFISDSHLRSLVKQVFYGNLLSILGKYLTSRDAIALCHVFPTNKHRLYPLINKLVTNAIDTWFRNYFDFPRDTNYSEHPNIFNDYAEFKTRMVSSKGVISGSFVLQMILGEEWKDSDIDIFIPSDNEKFRTNLDGLHLAERNNYYSSLEEFLFCDLVTMEGYCAHFRKYSSSKDGYDNLDQLIEDFGGKKCIERINNFDIDIKRDLIYNKIQVIAINEKIKPVDFVKNTFDFEICQNVFQYIQRNTEIEYELHIENLEEIINKRVGFKPSVSLKSSVHRCKKYVERGFKFYDDTEHAKFNHPDSSLTFKNIKYRLITAVQSSLSSNFHVMETLFPTDVLGSALRAMIL